MSNLASTWKTDLQHDIFLITCTYYFFIFRFSLKHHHHHHRIASARRTMISLSLSKNTSVPPLYVHSIALSHLHFHQPPPYSVHTSMSSLLPYLQPFACCTFSAWSRVHIFFSSTITLLSSESVYMDFFLPRCLYGLTKSFLL